MRIPPFALALSVLLYFGETNCGIVLVPGRTAIASGVLDRTVALDLAGIAAALFVALIASYVYAANCRHRTT